MDIQKKLFFLQDRDYGDFQSKLIPTIPRERIIGVRMPRLRSLAKELQRAEAQAFLHRLPHEYYEENMLHALLLEQIRDPAALTEALEAFLPYVDNWAVCDCMSLKQLRKARAAILPQAAQWLKRDHCYTVRFALGLLMRHFLEEDFRTEYLQWAADACCEEYYVNMMVAWYFATALCKQYDAAVRYLEEGFLPRWVHNKTIQKAIESHCIPPAQKTYLRTLRRKEK